MHVHCHYWTVRGHADSVNPLAVFTCCPKYSQFQNTNVSCIQQRLVCSLERFFLIICGFFFGTEGISSHYAGLTDGMADAWMTARVTKAVIDWSAGSFLMRLKIQKWNKTRNMSDVTACVPAEFRTRSLQNYTQKLWLMFFILLRFI